MESDRFDDLTTRLAQGLTRRRSVGLPGVAAVTALATPGIAAGKKKKKERCASGEYVCPAGSKTSCCPASYDCCPEAFADRPAICCSTRCCGTSSDCDKGGCASGCCSS